MLKKYIFAALIILLLLPTATLAYENPYGQYYTYEVYYNGEKLGLEPAKPVLKIGEPFVLTLEMTMKQECQVYVDISELGNNNYVVSDGPTEFDEYDIRIFKENETQTYEWTLKPTEEWAGGTMPIDFHYSIYVKEEYEPIVNSGFTAVLPYISTEYYEAPEPIPAYHSESDTNQAPAFTLTASLLAIALVALRKKC
jgi:sarcinarray family protein